VDEPGADLGLVAAMASSFRNKLIPTDMVVFGEVGLGGEVRGISQAEARIKESAKLGFKRCLLPRQNLDKLKRPQGFELIGVSNVQEAMNALF
jgi:DNA repair protein RadA/Sms